MKRIIRAARQRRIVSIDFAEPENASRRAAIAFFLVETVLLLPGYSPAPGEPVFAEQDGMWPVLPAPCSARFFEEKELAAHRIPGGRKRDDELRAILGQGGGTGAAGKSEQGNEANEAVKHGRNWT